MKLAFCLFKYFPYGGLQRDFLRIAKACHERGHEIHVYTMRWEGQKIPDFHLHIIDPKGWQNHTRGRMFAEQVKHALAENNYDLSIGFNKMPYLDLYYAADVCYKARIHSERNLFYRFLPRVRRFMSLEKAVFAQGNKTKIMLISPLQQAAFVEHYKTEVERFHLLPPGIALDRRAPANALDIRTAMRSTYGIGKDEFLLLAVGSGFKTKGLDRSIIALSALPDALRKRCHLYVIGQDNPSSFIKLAKRLGVMTQINFLGGRPDVPDFLLAADCLLHPAYHENTGTVLLEALVAGLPVVTNDVCGYAHYILRANAGIVLKQPFDQHAFNAALEQILTADRAHLKQNAIDFANVADIYHLPEKAADYIEKIGKAGERLSS